MIRTICILLLFVPLISFGQNKLGKMKTDVKKELNTPSLVETDSTIKIHFHDASSREIDLIYEFDKSGICIAEKTVTHCEDCLKPYLNAVLEQKDYGWKKINGNQYISNFGSQAMIELPVDEKDYSFTVFRATWSQAFYDLLIKNLSL